MEPPIQPVPHQLSRRKRLGGIVVAVIALLVVPAIVLANHQFSDVPTGASYHDEVEALVGAGITSGCGGTNYCPGSAVNRGQMAQFMTRGLGTTAAAAGTITASEAAGTYVATVALHTGGLPGGTGYVTVDADLSVLDLTGSCPCGVTFSMQDTTTSESGPQGLMVVGDTVVDGGMANSGSVSWVFEVPTGTDVEYGLFANIFTDTPVLSSEGTSGSTPEPLLFGSLTAEYSPFGTAGTVGPGPLSTDAVDWGGGGDVQGTRRPKE